MHLGSLFECILQMSMSSSLSLSELVGQVMSPPHFDQMSARSQVCGISFCMSKIQVPSLTKPVRSRLRAVSDTVWTAKT